MDSVKVELFKSRTALTFEEDVFLEILIPFDPPSTDFDHPLFKARCQSAILNLEKEIMTHQKQPKGILFSHFENFRERLLEKSCYKVALKKRLEGALYPELQKSVYCYEYYYQHCKELYSFFDHEWQCCLFFDMTGVGILEQIYGTSLEKIDCFSLSLNRHQMTHLREDASLGVMVPHLPNLKERSALQLVNLIKALNQFGIHYRLLPEFFMYEYWDGIEEIIVMEGPYTENGKRGLAGFKASMGKVIGVEGFEPPTYCSQSSRANQAALHPELN